MLEAQVEDPKVSSVATLWHYNTGVIVLQHQHYDTAYKKMAYKIHPCKTP